MTVPTYKIYDYLNENYSLGINFHRDPSNNEKGWVGGRKKTNSHTKFIKNTNKMYPLLNYLFYFWVLYLVGLVASFYFIYILELI